MNNSQVNQRRIFFFEEVKLTKEEYIFTISFTNKELLLYKVKVCRAYHELYTKVMLPSFELPLFTAYNGFCTIISITKTVVNSHDNQFISIYFIISLSVLYLDKFSHSQFSIPISFTI